MTVYLYLVSTEQVCSELYLDNLKCRSLIYQGLSQGIKGAEHREYQGHISKHAHGQPPLGLEFRFCFYNFLLKIRSQIFIVAPESLKWNEPLCKREGIKNLIALHHIVSHSFVQLTIIF